MKSESGAPAFDNVDELLAERIVKHSRRHTEQPGKQPSSPAGKQPTPEAVQEEDQDENSGPLIVAATIVLLVVLFLLYRLFDRKPS